MERLLALKGRRLAKGVILVAARVDQLAPFVDWPVGFDKDAVLATWPGPVTWLLPARGRVPDWLTGGTDAIAARVIAHAQCAALCEMFGGALVSTSANYSGRSPARTALQVRRQFPTGLDFVLSGSVGGEGGPSEIRDARSGRIIRARIAQVAAPGARA